MNIKKTLYVVGAIVVQDGRILAVKRGASKNAEVAYKYEFVGGKIEEGESPEAALKREALEEMDYSIEVGEPFMRSVYEYEEVIVDLRTFICKPLSQSFVLNEHVDSKWLLPEELFSVEWAPADRDILYALSAVKF